MSIVRRLKSLGMLLLVAASLPWVEYRQYSVSEIRLIWVYSEDENSRNATEATLAWRWSSISPLSRLAFSGHNFFILIVF